MINLKIHLTQLSSITVVNLKFTSQVLFSPLGAKAVRATALANAKVALEEAFGERVQALFAERLKEEAADDISPSETMMQPSEDGMSQEETMNDAEL